MNRQELIEQAARQLWDAEKNHRACAPVRELFGGDLDIETAYAVQKTNDARRLAEGGRIVGRKIGLTSEAVQQQLGVDTPDYGSLYADMITGPGDILSLGRLLQPKIEVEAALVLKKDLPQADTTLIDLINATDYVLPAVEIVDSRIAGWDIRIGDTVADNASSGMVAVGQHPVRLDELDLTQVGMALYQNGDLLSSGNGAACMGNPLIAAVWLARVMARKNECLRAGDLILTGAMGPMVAVNAPGSYQADIQNLGSITVEFGE